VGLNERVILALDLARLEVEHAAVELDDLGLPVELHRAIVHKARRFGIERESERASG
jgi:hypothetical protein